MQDGNINCDDVHLFGVGFKLGLQMIPKKWVKLWFKLILNFASAFGTFEFGRATSLSYQAAS